MRGNACNSRHRPRPEGGVGVRISEFLGMRCRTREDEVHNLDVLPRPSSLACHDMPEPHAARRTPAEGRIPHCAILIHHMWVLWVISFSLHWAGGQGSLCFGTEVMSCSPIMASSTHRKRVFSLCNGSGRLAPAVHVSLAAVHKLELDAVVTIRAGEPALSGKLAR